MDLIYEFSDYREFLKTWYEKAKEKNPLFSYRAFSKKAGFASSSFVKLLVDGKRNLGDGGIAKLARALNLNENQRKYFEILIRMNQATTPEEKDYFFRELIKNKGFLRAKPFTKAEYNLYSKWYYIPIAELLRLEHPRPKDAKWVRGELDGDLGLIEVKWALRELRKLGVVERNKKGSHRCIPDMKAPDEAVRIIGLPNFHREMSLKAAEAVIHHHEADREFSGLTIALSEEGFDIAKREIETFRKHLHSILEQLKGQPKKMLCHINLQLFKMNRSGLKYKK